MKNLKLNILLLAIMAASALPVSAGKFRPWFCCSKKQILEMQRAAAAAATNVTVEFLKKAEHAFITKKTSVGLEDFVEAASSTIIEQLISILVSRGSNRHMEIEPLSSETTSALEESLVAFFQNLLEELGLDDATLAEMTKEEAVALGNERVKDANFALEILNKKIKEQPIQGPKIIHCVERIIADRIDEHTFKYPDTIRSVAGMMLTQLEKTSRRGSASSLTRPSIRISRPGVSTDELDPYAALTTFGLSVITTGIAAGIEAIADPDRVDSERAAGYTTDVALD